MPHLPSHLLSAADRPLALRARGDLEAIAVTYSGQASVVLKDPLTLEMYHLTNEEHFLFEQLRQEVSLSELKRRFEQRFAPRTVSTPELHQAASGMAELGLLLSTAPGQGRQLLQRAEEHRRRQRWQHWLSVLSIRVANWDATVIVNTLERRLKWVFSPMPGIAAMLLIGYALWLLVGHPAEISERLPAISELTQPRYWLLWLATIVGLKVVHELAHAVTCRHFGAECHEMGVMLLALFPALYCDVSDVWRIPSKRQRMAVSAAGMIAEVTIAATAFSLAWIAQPGLLQTWLLGVAVIASVGTLLVNVNPLLRYDGYYLLSDWLEIPNLSDRARVLAAERVRHWLLKQPQPADPFLTIGQQRRVFGYAIASRVYAVFLLLAIFATLLSLSRPYHLENIVWFVAGVTLLGMLVPPLWAAGRFFANPACRARVQRDRLAVCGVAVAAVFALVLLVPVSHTVVAPAVLVPAERATLYATVGGQLEFAVSPGTKVQAGDTVARLVAPEIELAVAQQRGELAEKQARVAQLTTLRVLDSRYASQLPTAQAEATSAAGLLAEHARRAEELNIRSPLNGTVIAPPDCQQKVDEGQLATWAGSPLDGANKDCLLEPGMAICSVGNSDRLAALLTVDERDIAEVQPGDSVRILLASAPVRILTGTVVQVASRAAEPTADDKSPLAGRTHLVEVQLDGHDPLASVGGTGTAKIVAERQTLGGLITSAVKRRLRLPW